MDGKIYLGLTQEETELFPSLIYIEGQINFIDKSVAKTETIRKFVDATLFTLVVSGNVPAPFSSEVIAMSVGEIVTVNGATFTPISTLLNSDTLELSWENDKQLQNPLPVTITAPSGKDYTLTEQDKQDIANIIGVEFPTNTSLDEILKGGE